MRDWRRYPKAVDDYATRVVEESKRGAQRVSRQVDEMVALLHEMYPSKTKAHPAPQHRSKIAAQVAKAVRDGRLVRPPACPACGSTGRAVHAHHADYSKPLDVEWLCAACHAKRHADEKRATFLDALTIER